MELLVPEPDFMEMYNNIKFQLRYNLVIVVALYLIQKVILLA